MSGPVHTNFGPVYSKDAIDSATLDAMSRSMHRGDNPTTTPQNFGDGLAVVMRSVKGLTAPRLLKTPFYFQCPPLESFPRDHAFSHAPYDTVSAGQFLRPQGRQLATVSFQTLFVDTNTAWTLSHDPSTRPHPLRAVQELREILEQGTPFELIVGQWALWGQYDLHWCPANENAAVMTTLHIEERAGEVDARYVTIGFQEYRSISLKRPAGQHGRRDPARGRHLPAVEKLTRTTSSKMTLYSLSRTYYGDQSSWRLIAKANGITNWPPSRPLVDYLKSRKESSLNLKIPAPGVTTHWSGEGQVPPDPNTSPLIADLP